MSFSDSRSLFSYTMTYTCSHCVENYLKSTVLVSSLFCSLYCNPSKYLFCQPLKLSWSVEFQYVLLIIILYCNFVLRAPISSLICSISIFPRLEFPNDLLQETVCRVTILFINLFGIFYILIVG